jgi:predicted transposase/invertase (TIGR01784 family)
MKQSAPKKPVSSSLARPVVSLDFAFKRLFKDKADHRILAGFLSALFKKEVSIKAVLDPAFVPKVEEGKSNCVDVKVQIDRKEIAIVEVQFAYEHDFFQRILFGASTAVCEQLQEGEKYEKIKKVYSVDIVYFPLGRGDDYIYHGSTTFTGMNTGKLLALSPEQKKKFRKTKPGDLFPEYYIINPNRFKSDDATTDIEEWVYYLKKDEIKDSFKAKGMEQAKERWGYYNLSPELRRDYRKEKDRIRGLDGVVEASWDKGFAKGEATGKAAGRAEGREEGRAEGARSEKLANARNLKLAGVALDVIAQATGLTVSEVEAL